MTGISCKIQTKQKIKGVISTGDGVDISLKIFILLFSQSCPYKKSGFFLIFFFFITTSSDHELIAAVGSALSEICRQNSELKKGTTHYVFLVKTNQVFIFIYS